MYERLIGLIKKSIKFAIGRNHITFEELQTIMTEIEAVVNSRPLMHVSEDAKDAFHILRPIDFLIPHGQIGTETFDFDPTDPDYSPHLDSAGKLLKLWQTSQIYLEKYWDTFYHHYLTALNERYQYIHKQPFHLATEIPKEGSVVLIRDDQTPRRFWKLGLILKLNYYSTGNIKSADVLSINKNVLTRPISLLHPLEIDSKLTHDQLKDYQQFHLNKPEAESSPSNNRPMTRSQTQLSKNLMPSLTIMLTLSFLSISSPWPIIHTLECPQNESLVTIDSQTCVSVGLVVKKIPNGNLCWNQVNCSTGHLQKDGHCGKKCPCPSWADYCSYAPQVKSKVDADLQKTILAEEKPVVCSFVPSTKCSKEPSQDTFGQIQLHDGSKHLVKHMNIKIAEQSPEQYDCIGSGSQTGSEQFCKHHNCNPTGSKFCYYKENDKAFFVAESGEIQIKAWGNVISKFYPEKSAPSSHVTCKACELHCKKGGIEIILDEKIGKISICSKPVCYTIAHPELKQEVPFPSVINLHEHDIQVKVWYHGSLIRTMGITCKADPFCESIDCYFCLVRFANPQCAPIIALILLFVLLQFGTITLLILLRLVKIISKLLYFLSFCCGKLCYLIYKKLKKPKPVLPTINEAGRRRRQFIYTPRSSLSTTSLSIIITFITTVQLPMTELCSQAVTLTAKSTTCINFGDPDFSMIKECVFNEVTRLALAPQGQNTCLLIQQPEGAALGTLKINIQKIQMKCQAQNQYFTRSFKMKVTASKRCSGSGSCTNNKCHDYNKDSKISELGNEANTHPGYTYCTDAPGGIFNGCFWPTSACLFYRVYAVPKSDQVFEVFKCPVWHFQITARLTVDIHGSKSEHTMTLEPGVEHEWKQLKLALIGVVNPPTPLLGSSFLTTGEQTIKVSTSASGQPVSGTVGQLQCSNYDKAKEFSNCYLPHDICLCQSQDDKASCTCTMMVLENLFKREAYALPIVNQGITISGTGKEIYAEFNTFASLEIQITMINMKLAYATTESTCHITTDSNISGCYDCLTGAKLQFKCSTDQGSVLAHIRCGKAFFTTQCNETGIEGVATMSFNGAKIKERCEVHCQGQTTYFNMEGTLNFVEKNRIGNISNIIAGHYGSPDSIELGKLDEGIFKKLFGGLDFNFIGKWLTSEFFWVIIIILTVILSFFLCLPMVPICLRSCAKKIQQLPRYMKEMSSKVKDKIKSKFGYQHKPSTKNL